MKTQFLLVFVMLFSTGCGVEAMYGQKLARFKVHNKNKENGSFGGDVLAYSFPAELRETNIQQRSMASCELLMNNPNIKHIHDAVSKELNVIFSTQSSADQKTQARAKIREYVEELSVLIGERTLILAAPPPDVSLTPDGINLTINGGEYLKGAEATINGLLGQTAEAISKSTESDVKRHLAYRLNEALVNYPEIIGPVYADLFRELILRTYDSEEANKAIRKTP